MKALITGSSGFVGPYLKQELEKHNYRVFGFDRNNISNAVDVFCGDVREQGGIEKVIKLIQPDEVYHLAGFSSVKKSFDEPKLAYEINVGGTRNLLNSINKVIPRCKILIVSSAEVYGNPKTVPISEGFELQPTSPYSRSRIDQESLIKEFPNLHIIISRSFNHTGPGQSDTFVLSDFAKQVAKIEKHVVEPILATGDLQVVRDFSDVRDVVNAYYMLLQKGKPGEKYNVGSGRGYVLEDLLSKLIKLSKVKIDVRRDFSKSRPIDILRLIADITKIKQDIGWMPKYSIDSTIMDLLNYWRNN